jgi:hypothetical protein
MHFDLVPLSGYVFISSPNIVWLGSNYGKEIEGFHSFFKACKSCPCKVILALVKLEHSEGKGY